MDQRIFLMTDKAGERSAEDTYAPSQIWNSSLGQQLPQHSGSLSHRIGGWGGKQGSRAQSSPLPECNFGKYQVFVKKSCKCCFLLHPIFAFVIIK